MAAQGRSTSSGTITQAEATSAPAPTSAARASRRPSFRGAANGQNSNGASARYPVSKCSAMVRAIASAAPKKLRPSRIVLQLSPQAIGRVTEAHSCVHTP